jgi:WD40 repeat protein
MEGLMKRVVGLTFAADGKSLIAATHNNTIRRWSIEKGEEEKSFLVEPAAFISGAALHSESGVAVTLAGFDDRLFVWDLNSGERFATEIGVPGASSHCVALSPDGRIVAFAFQPSAVADVEVGLWTTSMGRQLDRWRVGDYQINALAFSPDGRRLVGGTDLGTALVWDIGAAVDKFFGAKP